LYYLGMTAKHHFTFRQYEDDRKMLENLAKETNQSISDLVRLAIHKTYHLSFLRRQESIKSVPI